MNYETSEPSESKPELVKQTEDFFFFCQNNMTQDAKNTVWRFLNLAKKSYLTSPHKQEWNLMLTSLQTIMNDFHNDYSTKSELKLAAVHRTAEELMEEEGKPFLE
ncbi:MAG: hypothetical protein KW788_05170 [Candidatus Doudnabacteria bacterium]|nr:hypothetical protein [Candidatus Doudnabacteria bacterium]